MRSQVVDGYFVHYFAPSSMEVVAKNVVFVIDTSGSMGGSKLEQTKQAMAAILDDLHSDDMFSVIQFNDAVNKWREDGLVRVDEKNIAAAKEFVNGLEAGSCKRHATKSELIV